jgi:hypothetical protein
MPPDQRCHHRMIANTARRQHSRRFEHQSRETTIMIP